MGKPESGDQTGKRRPGGEIGNGRKGSVLGVGMESAKSSFVDSGRLNLSSTFHLRAVAA